MMKSSEQVEGYIARLPQEQREIAVALRKIIGTAALVLEETIKWGYPCYIGAGNVCSIMAYKDHVNLAFFRGTELTDPDGLLEGTGKGMRHVKVCSVTNLPEPSIAALVRAAATLDLDA